MSLHSTSNWDFFLVCVSPEQMLVPSVYLHPAKVFSSLPSQFEKGMEFIIDNSQKRSNHVLSLDYAPKPIDSRQISFPHYNGLTVRFCDKEE